MADELLDLVNEDDDIIGEVWKSTAHKDPKLIHREISVIISYTKNKVLFQLLPENSDHYLISQIARLMPCHQLPGMSSGRYILSFLHLINSKIYIHLAYC